MKNILPVLIAIVTSSILYAQDPSSRLVPDSNGVYTTVQKLAQFPGGEKGMMEFISKAIKYPKAELKNDIQGKVSVKAIIDEQGKIISSEIEGSVSPGLDKEALRVVSTFPTLTPAVVNGKNVKSRYYFPVVFNHPEANNRKIPITKTNYTEDDDGPMIVGIDGAVEEGEPMMREVSQNTPKVYAFVEQMPKYIGGEKAMLAFIHKNLHYPKTDNNDLPTGRVFVRFIINEDGRVSDATIMRSINEALDKEVLRVVSALPNFKPGMQQGKAVKVYYTLPINFELPK